MPMLLLENFTLGSKGLSCPQSLTFSPPLLIALHLGFVTLHSTEIALVEVTSDFPITKSNI